MPAFHASDLYSELILRDEKFWASMNQTAARAAEQATKLGVTMGAGVGRGLAQQTDIARNLAFGVGDAAAAFGQFGLSANAAKMAMVGFTNNAQTMILAISQLKGVGLAGLFTPQTLGLTAGMAALGVLPALFNNVGKSANEAKTAVTDFYALLAERDKESKRFARERALGFVDPKEGALGSLEHERRQKEKDILDAMAARDAAREKTRGELKDVYIGPFTEEEVRERHERAREEDFKMSTMIRAEQDRLLAIEAKITTEREKQAMLAAQALSQRMAGTFFGGVGPIHSFADAREEQRRIRRAEEEAAKQALDEQERRLQAFRETRDRRLQIEAGELELQRLRRGDAQPVRFTSPENLIQSIQSNIGSDADKQIANQEKQIQLQQKQNEIGDQIVDTLRQGTLWGGWVP